LRLLFHPPISGYFETTLPNYLTKGAKFKEISFLGFITFLNQGPYRDSRIVALKTMKLLIFLKQLSLTTKFVVACSLQRTVVFLFV
jgi:hypothetical protein